MMLRRPKQTVHTKKSHPSVVPAGVGLVMSLLLAVTSVLLLVLTNAQAGPQFTLLDGSYLQQPDALVSPSYTSPTNWVAPTNYRDGRVYMKFKVLSKPSSLNTRIQLCFWRDSGNAQTCGPIGVYSLTDEGTYWIDTGAPAGWWKKDSTWDWTQPISGVWIVLKDRESGQLLMNSNCGANCYPRDDLASHVPIQFEASVVVVPQNSALVAPASWAGCPSSWGCGSSTTPPPPPPPPTPNPPSPSPISPTTPKPSPTPPAPPPSTPSDDAEEVPVNDGLVITGEDDELITSITETQDTNQNRPEELAKSSRSKRLRMIGLAIASLAGLSLTVFGAVQYFRFHKAIIHPEAEIISPTGETYRRA